MAGDVQHHDDGLAHDARLLTRVVRLLHLEENHSYQMLRRSKACVINLPTLNLVDTVVGIGNCSLKCMWPRRRNDLRCSTTVVKASSWFQEAQSTAGANSGGRTSDHRREDRRETLANLSITGHLRRFSDQPVAEIVQCSEAILSTIYRLTAPEPQRAKLRNPEPILRIQSKDSIYNRMLACRGHGGSAVVHVVVAAGVSSAPLRGDDEDLRRRL